MQKRWGWRTQRKFKDATVTMELTVNSTARKAVALLGGAGLLFAFMQTYTLIEQAVQSPWWECWPQTLAIIGGIQIFRIAISGQEL